MTAFDPRAAARIAESQIPMSADYAQDADRLTAEGETEKLAKARRMAKAFSAPPAIPPEWATTTEWPRRHKRPADRRVHATAAFIANSVQQFWTACGEHVGEGGYPLSHMPVDCRACRRAVATSSEGAAS